MRRREKKKKKKKGEEEEEEEAKILDSRTKATHKGLFINICLVKDGNNALKVGSILPMVANEQAQNCFSSLLLKEH